MHCRFDGDEEMMGTYCTSGTTALIHFLTKPHGDLIKHLHVKTNKQKTSTIMKTFQNKPVTIPNRSSTS